VTPAAPSWHPSLSVNSLCSRSYTLAEDLDLYERLGISRVTLFFPKIEAFGVEAAVAEVARRRLSVDGLLPGRSFDLADEASWPEVNAALGAVLAVAERLGARTLQTTGGRARGLRYEAAAERFARAVEPVAAEARRRGLHLALEPTRPQFAHLGFVHTLRDGLALATELDLMLVPDTAHEWWEPGLDEVVRAGAARFAAIQVADLGFDGPILERRVPGDGEIPIASMLSGALAAGYEGPIELEILGSVIEDEGYDSAIVRSLTHLSALLAAADGP
jgi:sugar phosphate isomerase/epimerase